MALFLSTTFNSSQECVTSLELSDSGDLTVFFATFLFLAVSTSARRKDQHSCQRSRRAEIVWIFATGTL